jgi:hypothetical protein
VLLAAGLLSAGSLDPVYLDSGRRKAEKNDAATPKAKPAPADADKAAKPVAAIETDLRNHRVSIRGHFTDTHGALELGACTAGGKTYLSPLGLATRPSKIAEAMRRIGVEPGDVPVVDRRLGTATEPKGRKVNLFVQWHVTRGNEVVLRRAALEEFFWNRSADTVMAKGPWIYAGSKLVRDATGGSGLFVADLSGTVAAITRLDTGALFYYGGPSPRNDVWSPAAGVSPAKGTACRLIVELVPEAKPKAEATPKTDGGEKPDDDAPPGEAKAPPDKPAPESDPAEPGAAPPEAAPDDTGNGPTPQQPDPPPAATPNGP